LVLPKIRDADLASLRSLQEGSGYQRQGTASGLNVEMLKINICKEKEILSRKIGKKKFIYPDLTTIVPILKGQCHEIFDPRFFINQPLL
jgi:hypothetical protein